MTVCSVESTFFTVIRVPALATRGLGENAKSLIVGRFDDASEIGVRERSFGAPFHLRRVRQLRLLGTREIQSTHAGPVVRRYCERRSHPSEQALRTIPPRMMSCIHCTRFGATTTSG